MVLFKKTILLISTTPALRATPPHLRRGVIVLNTQIDRPRGPVLEFVPVRRENSNQDINIEREKYPPSLPARRRPMLCELAAE